MELKKKRRKKKGDYDFSNPFEVDEYRQSQEEKRQRQQWGDNY